MTPITYGTILLGALWAGPATPGQGTCLMWLVLGQSSTTVQFSLGDSDPEQLYFDALRQRRLYSVLERYCRKQLQRGELTPADEVRYTIELANVLAIRADEQTGMALRSDLWRKASALVRDFLQRHPAHPQSVVLRFQLGMIALAQGERLSRRSLVIGGFQGKQEWESAHTQLLSAARSFQEVDSQVGRLLGYVGPLGTSGRPSSKQLRALRTNVRFRLGQAWLALARLAPQHSADRTEFASNAKAQFDTIAARYSTSGIVLESFLGRSDALRLLGDAPALAEAKRCLHAIQRDETPAEYRDRALVMHARIALDQLDGNRVGPGLAITRDFVRDTQKMLQSPDPEMDLLYVEATLRLAVQRSQADDTLVAQTLVADAVQATEQVGQNHGKYWLARCELLLAELVANRVLVQDLRVLRRMADGQYRKGDRSGAVMTLDRAVKLAAEQEKVDSAVQLGLRAAAIEADLEQFQRAADRCARLAETYPNHPRAGEAHFFASYCLGKAYQADPTPEGLQRYQQSLEQHLRRFGAGPTVSEVRWLLGMMRMTQRRWAEAVELLGGVASGHPRAVSARQALGPAYENWLEDLWSRSKPAEQVVDRAIRHFQQALQAPGPDQLRPQDVPLALGMARILIHPKVAHYEQAETVLEQVLFGQAANQPERHEARRLEVLALVAQDKFDAARAMLQTEFAGVPLELFAVVRSLEQAAQRAAGSRRRSIGRLQLIAGDRLSQNAQELTRDQRVQTQVFRALALVNAGESNRADELFKLLPKSPRVIQARAECYMQLARYDQARALWRELLALVPQNTTEWFRTKYQLALVCFHSGDVQQCAKIIRITRILHPELGGPELAAKFRALEEQCSRRSRGNAL